LDPCAPLANSESFKGIKWVIEISRIEEKKVIYLKYEERKI